MKKLTKLPTLILTAIRRGLASARRAKWPSLARERLPIILGLSVVAMIGTYSLGFALSASKGLKDFHVNILVEGVGLFGAVIAAWLLFDRYAQRQAQKIAEGVHQRISLLRNRASWPVTYFTTHLLDIPPSGGGGPYFVKENYDLLRKKLEDFKFTMGEEFVPLPPGVSQSEGAWYWIFQEFVILADQCKRTEELYVTGLATYPELLNLLERVQSTVMAEAPVWKWFTETPGHDRRAELPAYAIVNMKSMALVTLDLIATINSILGDWPVPKKFAPYTPTSFHGGTWQPPRGAL